LKQSNAAGVTHAWMKPFTCFGMQAFHERYYHPSNARFWFYGDDPPEERLRILASFLDEFDARPVDSTVKPQPLFKVTLLIFQHICPGGGHLRLALFCYGNSALLC
jgi:hypothetical protein